MWFETTYNNVFCLSQVCSCKNTCSRKKTSKSEGCPCKNANLSCCDNCKCGTKKASCKNKSAVGEVNRNPSAFARHQEQLANAESEIKVSNNSKVVPCLAFVNKLWEFRFARVTFFTPISQSKCSVQLLPDLSPIICLSDHFRPVYEEFSN